MTAATTFDLLPISPPQNQNQTHPQLSSIAKTPNHSSKPPSHAPSSTPNTSPTPTTCACSIPPSLTVSSTPARQLAKLGIDIIEEGFLVASKDDFEVVVKGIGNFVDENGYVPVICGLSRCNERDIKIGLRKGSCSLLKLVLQDSPKRVELLEIYLKPFQVMILLIFDAQGMVVVYNSLSEDGKEEFEAAMHVFKHLFGGVQELHDVCKRNESYVMSGMWQ